MSFTLSDFLKTRINLSSQPSPWVCFYEVALPDSSFLRYVDFFDQEAATPGEISFDGKTWSGVDIYRGDMQENMEGGRSQLALSVYDPLRIATYYLRAYQGLVGQTVNFWITTYDHIATPADALTASFRIISSFITEDPAIVTLVLGHFNLFEARFPRIFYDRRRCYNLFHDRHEVGNWCRYPSIEFGAQNEFDYKLGGANEEKARRQGWYTQQALRAETFKSHLATAGKLKITSKEPICIWDDQERRGPYFYRYLDGDYDVNTVIAAITGRDDWMAGFILQDTTQASPDPEPGEPPPEIPKSDWLFIGLQDNGASGAQLVIRKTVDDLSGNATYPAVSDTRIRVKRVGSTFTIYTRADDESSWTQRHQSTLALPTVSRIGVAIASPTETTDEFGAEFDYIRFDSGGLTTCRRDYDDCLAHENTLQFNGYREIPSDRGRY